MDTPHWPQGMGLVKPPMEEFASSMTTATAATTSSNGAARPAAADRRPRPSKEQALNCPRCNSTNTKFCYYNNYSLTQPRYFCKTCRRYWTEGGSLRNIPVGGGSRKNKRITPAAAAPAVATASAAKKLCSPDDLVGPAPYISLSTASEAPKFLEGQDLNLAFHHPAFGDYPNLESSGNSGGAFPGVGPLSAMEMLKSRMHFMAAPMPTPPPPPLPLDYAAAGFGLQEFRPTTLSFPLDATRGGSVDDGGGSGAAGGSSKFLFPFEDLKPVAAAASSNPIVADQFEQQSKGQGGAGDPPGFWSGIINGGGSW